MLSSPANAWHISVYEHSHSQYQTLYLSDLFSIQQRELFGLSKSIYVSHGRHSSLILPLGIFHVVTVVQSCEGGASEVTCTTVVSAGGGWGGRHADNTTTNSTHSSLRTYRSRRCSVVVAAVAALAAAAPAADAGPARCSSGSGSSATAAAGTRAAPTQTRQCGPPFCMLGILV